MTDRKSISFNQLKRVCVESIEVNDVMRCHALDQPQPFEHGRMIGPVGKCTQGRCPIWKRWNKDGEL